MKTRSHLKELRGILHAIVLLSLIVGNQAFSPPIKAQAAVPLDNQKSQLSSLPSGPQQPSKPIKVNSVASLPLQKSLNGPIQTSVSPGATFHQHNA